MSKILGTPNTPEERLCNDPDAEVNLSAADYFDRQTIEAEEAAEREYRLSVHHPHTQGVAQ